MKPIIVTYSNESFILLLQTYAILAGGIYAYTGEYWVYKYFDGIPFRINQKDIKLIARPKKK